MKIIDAVHELVKMGLNVQLDYDKERDLIYYDLNTKAKSWLHLFEDWHVEGRYDYTAQLDGEQELEEILKALFWEFKDCIHGREYYNGDWMEIGVKLGCVEKKVETKTTVTYG